MEKREAYQFPYSLQLSSFAFVYLTVLIIPKSPCNASPGCKKQHCIPRLFIVATIFWPILPLFPTPLTMSLFPRQTVLAMELTADDMAALAVTFAEYRFSIFSRAFRSDAMTWIAVSMDLGIEAGIKFAAGLTSGANARGMAIFFDGLNCVGLVRVRFLDECSEVMIDCSLSGNRDCIF